MDEFNELFSELEAIDEEKYKCIKKLEAENKQKDDYIRKLKKTVESLKLENEERRERFIEDRQKLNNKDYYIYRLETRLIKIEQILNSRSLTRAEALPILRN